MVTGSGTCRQPAGPQQGPRPAAPGPGAVQQLVRLQEAVERAEDGGGEHDGQRHGAASGQGGVDQAPGDQNPGSDHVQNQMGLDQMDQMDLMDLDQMDQMDQMDLMDLDQMDLDQMDQMDLMDLD